MPITVAQFMGPRPGAATQGVEGVGESRPRQAPALGGGANVQQLGGSPSVTAMQGGRQTTRAAGAKAQGGTGFVNVGDYLGANQRAGAAQNTNALTPLTDAAKAATDAVGGLQVEETNRSGLRRARLALDRFGRTGQETASTKLIEQHIGRDAPVGALDAERMQQAQSALEAGRPVAEQLSDRGQIAQAISPESQGFGAALNTQLFVGDQGAQTALQLASEGLSGAETQKAALVAEQARVNAIRERDQQKLEQRLPELVGEARQGVEAHVKAVNSLREAPMGLSYEQPMRQAVVPASRDFAGLDRGGLGAALGLLPAGFDLRGPGSDRQLETRFRNLTATQARARLRAIHDQAQRTEMSKEDFVREARAYMATGDRTRLFGRHPLEKAPEALPQISSALKNSLHAAGFTAQDYITELQRLPPAFKTQDMTAQAHQAAMNALIDRARETGRSTVAKSEALNRMMR